MATPTRTKILIGTPAYGGLCCVSYVSALINTIRHCASLGIEVEPCFLANESLIPRARNTVVAKFMNDPSFTHLLFIDADVNWSPLCIPKLLSHNKDVIGAMYPKKGYDWQKLIKNKEIIKTMQNAVDENRDLTDTEMGHIRTKLLSFVANLRQTESKISGGLVSMLHIGTGFMMIKRHVVQKMMDAFPQLKHDDDIGALNASENNYLYSLFDCEIHEIKNKRHYLSEDYLFCKRWTDIGGEIFADITVSLTHTGSHSFAGNFAVAHNLTRPAATPAAPPVAQPAPEEEYPSMTIEKVEAPAVEQPTPVEQPAEPQEPQKQYPGPVPIATISEAQTVIPAEPVAEPKPKKRLSPSELSKIQYR